MWPQFTLEVFLFEICLSIYVVQHFLTLMEFYKVHIFWPYFADTKKCAWLIGLHNKLSNMNIMGDTTLIYKDSNIE